MAHRFDRPSFSSEANSIPLSPWSVGLPKLGVEQDS